MKAHKYGKTVMHMQRHVPASLIMLAALHIVSLTPPTNAAEDNEPISTIDLSGEWAFAYTPAHTESPPAESAFATTIPVPGCWDDRFDRAQAEKQWPNATFNPASPIVFPIREKVEDASFPFLVGTGWYCRTIDVPAEWQNRQVTLNVGRVVMEAWVYVNGHMVHHHLGHSTDFVVPLTDHLNVGQANRLVIAVDNTRTDRIGCVIRGWKGRSAGIFGPVTLRTAGTARIADLYVYPDAEILHWHVALDGNLPAGSELYWQVLDSDGKTAVAHGVQPAAEKQVRWTSDPKGMKPWSDRQPYLYQLEVCLRAGDRRLDVCRQPFGLRRLTTVGTNLRFNDRPIFLRGVCEHAYFAQSCTPPLAIDWYRNHLHVLKSIGFNWLRFHTWVPPEPYLQAADQLGFLVQVEPPRGYAMPEWQDILLACRKHPSVVIYCCGNEEQLDDAKVKFLRQCAAEQKALAPDALFNPQEALRGVEYEFTPDDRKTMVGQPFPHNPARLAKLKEFSDVFTPYALGMTSYFSLTGVPSGLDSNHGIYERPCMTHELGIAGCYLDLSLEDRYKDTRIGTGLFRAARESLANAGLADRAATYYRNSAAWQRLILKDAMETVRHCRLLAGYDCLGANDSHWIRMGYGCGVLNEFDEMKPGRSVEDILSYNGESVLLVNKQRERNLQAGSMFERELSLSWFGEGTLHAAELHWTLRDTGGNVLCEHRSPVADIEPGTVTPITPIAAALPKIEQPAKATLEAQLTAPNVSIRNRWDYWIFPPASPTPASNVAVVTSIDSQTIRGLAAGQRVVLLGHKPFPTRPMTFQIGVAGRAEQNFATVIAKHPLADRFPHDGYCDWQFRSMLNGVCVNLDALPETFDPILEVVSSYKQLHRQAALFEWRVGQGRLLVCTLQLPPSDPAAAFLQGQILSYAAGDQFQPRTEISPEKLGSLLSLGEAGSPTIAPTDQGFDQRGQLPEKKSP